MRKRIAIFILGVLSLWGAELLRAQPALAIDPTGCVYREGDDLHWAATNLDESAWQPIAAWPGVATRTPFFWLRCRFQPGRLAEVVPRTLQITGDLSYEVYVDGQWAGSFGNIQTGDHTVGALRDYRSPALDRPGGEIVVALRMAFTPEVLVIEPMPELSLGDAALMRGQYSQQVSANVRKRWIVWLSSGLIGAAGLFFFSLFWFDRSQRYLLWAGLCWICLAELRVNEFLHFASIPYPSRVETFLYGSGQFVEFCGILLFFRLADRPLTKFYRLIVSILFCAGVLYIPVSLIPLPSAVMLRWLIDASPHVGAFLQTAFVVGGMAPLFAFWPLTRLRRSQIPVACACFLWMVTEVPYLISLFPGVPRAGQFLLFSQQYRSVAILIAVATLTLLLIKRVRATNRQRATLEGEMEAARRIQQMLAPAQVDRAPGCDVEVAFSPAREVGGDFYLCRVLPDGRQRLLLGDVSGKGAAAAMTAALLIGAAERRDADSPAKLLDHLNLVLCDCKLGGFATCLCADITSSGRLTAANAGHPPPYYNGKELPLEPSLPLGITLQTEYAETALQLEAGDRLTMLSDGVVEATNPATNELFGFERTQQISGESAYRIASAAQQFGQEDDITLLTLKFAGSEVMLA